MTQLRQIAGSGGDGGCFRAGTKVQLEHGATIDIERLKVGDKVLSFNEQGGIEVSTVTVTHVHEGPNALLRVKFWRGETHITPNHWVQNQYGSFVEIGALTTHDALIDGMGHLRPITGAERIEPEAVYNLTVEPNHTFIADGIRVHNGGHRATYPTVAGSGGDDGGGKGGGGRAAVEDADTLHSRAMVTVVDLIGEGEIGGLVNGAQSIFFNETPLQNANGTFNFTNVLWDARSGTQGQVPFEFDGYNDVETPHGISVKVEQAIPSVFSVNTVTVDAVRVIVTLPALISQDMTTGDTHGSSVEYKFEVSVNGGAYAPTGDNIIVSGKTKSRYQRSHLITLPKPGTTWNIKMTRITADSTSSSLQNETWLDSYVEISNTKLSYPNSAMIAARLDSQQFSSIPGRSYLVKGLYIQVPQNYDPVTREYTGVWNGTFKVALSNNPAWVLYDLLLSIRYGLGRYLVAAQIDKAALYAIGRYCDGMVADGFGGTEPRFTVNTSFQTRAEAFKLISDISSIFRGMSYWNGGMVGFTQDAPTDATMIFTPANVIGGNFEYAGGARKDRHSVVLVTWNDPSDRYRQKIEYVEDADLITQFGVRQAEIVAVGCSSRGQASRIGKWVLYTEQYESEMVTFSVGHDAAFVVPGNVIKIHDPIRAGKRIGGRIGSGTTTSVVLDTPTTIAAGSSIALRMPDGTFVERALAQSGTVSSVSWGVALDVAPAPNAMWVITEPALEPMLARVIGIAQGENKGEFAITALRHNPSKYAAIEQGLKLEEQNISSITGFGSLPPAPTSLSLTDHIYRSGSSISTMLEISWDGGQYSFGSWDVRYRVTNGNWKTQRTSIPSIDVANVRDGDTYEVEVISINALGKPNTTALKGSRTIIGKTLPPENISLLSAALDGKGVTLRWGKVSDIDLDSYEVKKGTDWATGIRLTNTNNDYYETGPLSAGAHTWMVRALDTTQHYSEAVASISMTIHVPAAPELSGAFNADQLVLSWTIASPDQGVKFFDVRYGNQGDTWEQCVSLGTTFATTFSTTAKWLGNRSFRVAATDVYGNPGPSSVLDVTVTPPSIDANSFRQQVIDNNVLLYWAATAGSLPIDTFVFRKGPTFAGSELIGTKSGAFTSLFELSAGIYTYWVVPLDTAGNAGTPVAVSATVTQPPDYVLRADFMSAFGGTLNNATVVENSLVLPVNSTETWAEHFTTNGWTSPQDQITAGFPLYLEPAPETSYYEETIDYGAVINTSKITITPTKTVIGGSPVAVCTISVKQNIGDPWQSSTGSWELFASSFQFVKFRIDVTGAGQDDLLQISSINVRLSTKLKNDAGMVACVSTDALGTIVNFDTIYLDVTSLALNPGGTASASTVYDFHDAVDVVTYSVTSDVCTVSHAAHPYVTGQKIGITPTSGTGQVGSFLITGTTANSYTVAMVTANTSGNAQIYPQSFRALMFNSTTGVRISGPASWSAKGY